MKIIIIGKDEIGIVKPLWEKLNAHHLEKSAHFKNHFRKFTFEKRMEGFAKREHVVVYVARENNEDIGYCLVSVDGTNGEIDSLFVDEAHRRKSVGEKLMSRALKWLEAQKYETIRVSIAEGNESALDFYRKFGFAERLTVMQLMDK